MEPRQLLLLLLVAPGPIWSVVLGNTDGFRWFGNDHQQNTSDLDAPTMSHGTGDPSLQDNDLGLDWLRADAGADNRTSFMGRTRLKRVAGIEMTNATFTMTEVASQSNGNNSATIGDSFTYEVILDLPGIGLDKKGDLIFEIFGLDSDNGVGGIHVCQAHEELITETADFGKNVKSIQEHPVYLYESPTHQKNFVAKTSIIREQLHTQGKDDSAAKNKIQVQFQAVVVNAGMDSDWQYANGKTHFIYVGAHFLGGEMVWLAQAEFTVSLPIPIPEYELRVTMEASPSGSDNWQKGSGYLFKIVTGIVDPTADVSLSVFQPLGYNDVFHVGHIQRRVGNAFACSPQENWEETYTLTPSGLSVNNATQAYQFLVNREALRDVSQPSNEIVFLVPVHVMNIDALPVGVERMLSFGLHVGGNKLWTSLETRIVSESMTSLPSEVAPVFKTAVMHNNVSKDSITKGDSIIVFVTMACPANTYCKMSVQMISPLEGEPAIPKGARVVNSGTVAYFPPSWSVFRNQEDELNVEFGSVQNAHDEETQVIFELAFALDPTVDDNYPIKFPTTKIGGILVPMPTDLVASNELNTEEIRVEAKEFGFLNEVKIHGQVGLEIEVTVPSGTGVEDVYVEAIPDLEKEAFTMRICTLRIMNIGRALPCLYHSNFNPQAEYHKSAETRPFNDMGSLNLGRLCPSSYPHSTEKDNQFTIRIVYEMSDPDSTPGDYRVSGGLRVQNDTIWVASREVATSTAPMNASGLETSTQSASPVNPILSAYPIITTRGREDVPFSLSEGFFIQYIVKFQPLTRGAFTLKIVPGLAFRACAIEVLHIGTNFPCTQPPGPLLTGYENMEFVYDTNSDGKESEFGEEIHLKLKGITNWGRTPLKPTLTPDEDSIQVVVFFQTSDSATPGNHTIGHKLSGSNSPLEQGVTDITVGTNKIVPDQPLKLGNFTSESTNPAFVTKGGFFKGAANIMRLYVSVPPQFLADMVVKVINLDFEDDKPIQFCNLTLVDKGQNLPCVHPINSVVTEHGSNSRVVDEHNLTIYESIEATIAGVCHFDYSKDPLDNMLTFEVAFRLSDHFEADTAVNLKVVISSEALESDEELLIQTPDQEAPMALIPEEGDIPVDQILPEEVKLVPVETNPGESNIGEIFWMAYNISLPRDKTAEMEVSLLVPSDNGRALFHVWDAKLAECEGKNIMCMGSDVDLQRTFPTNIGRSANLTTFMQHDVVSVDLGYVTNGGLSFKQRQYDDLLDDTFSIQFQIQLSDHEKWLKGTEFPIYCSVKIGDLIIVVTSTVSLGTKSAEEQGQMEMTVNQTKVGNNYEKGEIVYIQSIIRHNENSRREGYPTLIQVIAPAYMSYITSENSFITNYTRDSKDEEQVSLVNSTELEHFEFGSIFYFQFPQGISFPDIVELNFSLTVDPNEKRPVGSGIESSTIVMSPICIHTAKDWVGDPSVNSTMAQCGSMAPVELNTIAPECFDPIVFTEACQVTASSIYKLNLTNPVNVIPELKGESILPWAPSLRTPMSSRVDLQEFLEFNFLSAARINRILVHCDHPNFRKVKRVQIQYGSLEGTVANWGDPVSVKNHEIKIEPALEAQFVRIVIVSSDIAGANEKPVGISKVEFKGCFPKKHTPTPCPTEPRVKPIHSSADVSVMEQTGSPKKLPYRSFAVDDARNIVYFCDQTFVTEQSGGRTRCFSSNQDLPLPIWTEMPKYLRGLIGYDTAEEAMYFSGTYDQTCYMSRDGQRAIPKLCVNVSSSISNIVPAVNVKALGKSELMDLPWIGERTSYQANFEGIKAGDSWVALWKSCCISS